MSSALEQLAARIHQAHELGFLPTEWDTLARAALYESRNEWLSERAFRDRTHASDRWCRENFERCRENGLARSSEKRKREWHVHARLPHPGRDIESIKRD